jgi:DNA-binding LytR/AlgR family response regulator
VNVDYVERVEDWSHGSYLVYLRGGREPLRMSRRHAAALRARFG